MPTHEGQQYLKQFPKLQRWINCCAACGRQGYKPEMPVRITPGAAAGNLRRFLPPLAIDELGLCEQCRSAFDLPDTGPELPEARN